jgi:hypothetical protein
MLNKQSNPKMEKVTCQSSRNFGIGMLLELVDQFLTAGVELLLFFFLFLFSQCISLSYLLLRLWVNDRFYSVPLLEISQLKVPQTLGVFIH